MKNKQVMRGICSGILAVTTICGSAYAFVNPDAEPKTSVASTAVSANAAATGATTTSAVYLRSKPQNDAAIVCTIPANAAIQNVSQNGNWYQVSYNGKTGYIYKKFLKEIGFIGLNQNMLMTL